LVNNASIQSKYPILNYKGITYLPLRDIAEACDTNINWNKENKRIEINTKSKTIKTDNSSEKTIIDERILGKWGWTGMLSG
jgi:hypothetical protein